LTYGVDYLSQLKEGGLDGNRSTSEEVNGAYEEGKNQGYSGV